MGERKDQIFVIGSPDIDIMFSENLPPLKDVLRYYDVPFNDFAVLMFHPVTTEYDYIEVYTRSLVETLLEDDQNYIVIFPNNDMGSSKILMEYEKIKNHPRFRIFPSLRFEYFLSILKNSNFIIGNSSAGIREAPYYGIPSINIGTRQQNRALDHTIINSDFSKDCLKEALQKAKSKGKSDISYNFGAGNSFKLFHQIISENEFWEIPHQKLFNDISSL
jgi:UDP-N-acetylglucosamine 2-epimerase (hydrolysing)